MKFKPEKKYLQLGFTIFLTAIAIMAAYFLFFRLSSIKEGISVINRILAPIFYGLALAYLMTPLLNALERKILIPLAIAGGEKELTAKRKKHIRMIAVTITLLIVLSLIYLFFASVMPQLYSSIQNLIGHYNVYTDNLIKWINQTLEDNADIAVFLSKLISSYSTEADDFLNDIVLPTVQSFLIPNVNDMLSSLSASIIKLIMFVWNIVIGFIISIYVLSGKERFAQGSVRLCYAYMETKTANKFIDSMRFTHHTFIGFLSGKVIDSLIIGVMCYVFCLITKMPYGVLISVIVGVTNVIPYFGPYIGAIPSTIIILLVDPKKALTFIIFILILQQFDGNFLGPKILSQSTGLTSFWIIFSITLFGGLFGVIGMVVGVPITAVIASGIEHLTKTLLEKKNLPTEPEKYFEVGMVTDEGEMTHYEYHKPTHKQPNDKNLFIVLGKGICSILKKLFSKLFRKKKKKDEIIDKE